MDFFYSQKYLLRFYTLRQGGNSVSGAYNGCITAKNSLCFDTVVMKSLILFTFPQNSCGKNRRWPTSSQWARHSRSQEQGTLKRKKRGGESTSKRWLPAKYIIAVLSFSSNKGIVFLIWIFCNLPKDRLCRDDIFYRRSVSLSHISH